MQSRRGSAGRNRKGGKLAEVFPLSTNEKVFHKQPVENVDNLWKAAGADPNIQSKKRNKSRKSARKHAYALQISAKTVFSTEKIFLVENFDFRRFLPVENS